MSDETENHRIGLHRVDRSGICAWCEDEAAHREELAALKERIKQLLEESQRGWSTANAALAHGKILQDALRQTRKAWLGLTVSLPGAGNLVRANTLALIDKALGWREEKT
jgi:hypothetical protein